MVKWYSIEFKITDAMSHQNARFHEGNIYWINQDHLYDSLQKA
jgi:hypothetical protein